MKLKKILCAGIMVCMPLMFTFNYANAAFQFTGKVSSTVFKGTTGDRIKVNFYNNIYLMDPYNKVDNNADNGPAMDYENDKFLPPSKDLIATFKNHKYYLTLPASIKNNITHADFEEHPGMTQLMFSMYNSNITEPLGWRGIQITIIKDIYNRDYITKLLVDTKNEIPKMTKKYDGIITSGGKNYSVIKDVPLRGLLIYNAYKKDIQDTVDNTGEYAYVDVQNAMTESITNHSIDPYNIMNYIVKNQSKETNSFKLMTLYGDDMVIFNYSYSGKLSPDEMNTIMGSFLTFQME